MKTRAYVSAALGVVICCAIGCSSNPTEPPPSDGGGTGVLEPNPDGVLLGGDGASPAQDALAPLPPAAAEPGDIQDGFITTRLVAAISPGATTGDVNAALDAQGARIVSMNSGTPFVTLKIPAVADVGAARIVADALRDSGAFMYVAPAHAPKPDEPIAETLVAGRAGGGGSSALAHLERSRFIAAWNVRRLAAVNDDEIDVLVPDEYTSTLSSDEIDAQGFTGFGSPLPLPGPVIYPGNNGFVVSGIIGANVDETPPTGTNPYPADLLDIQSMALGGFTWTDIFWTLAWELASSGDRFVLNTGIGYNDPDYVTYSKLDRAMHVIAYRIAAALHYPKFVHVTSAGSPDGDPELNSPFIAAALFDDVREMVDIDELSQADSLSLETAWQDVLDAFPLASAIAGNVMTVAGADFGGNLLPYSAPGDVRALGVNVVGPCTSADPGGGVLCDGDVAAYSGSGVAAAQVSGLAAYLMNLSNVSPAQVRSIISSTYAASQTGLIDAFDAVLRLDGGAVGPVRETLLDVAGFQSSESDGDFDEFDLPTLAGLQPSGPGDRASRGGGGGETDPFIRRLDLNGDGVVGGFSTARFDLDGNGSYGVVTQQTDGQPLTLDENAVTDFDIVCYYAYSNLYGGDPEVRALLLVPAHAGIYVEILEFPERIPAGEPVELSVRAGLATARGGEPDGMIEISLEVDNGYAEPSSGEIEPGGTFTTMVTLNEYDNELFVEAWAELGNEEVNATTSALRFDEIEFVERYVFVGSQVFSTYCQDFGIPCQEIANVPDFEIIEDTTDLIDEEYDAVGSGSAAGMQISGQGSATIVNNLDIGTGTNFSGTTLDGTVDGTITLTNPSTDILSYQAQAGGWVDVSIEFNVWGEPAPFALSGSVNSQYYDVDLDGDEQIFECDSSDKPCSTISVGGLLQPGNYDLDMYIEAEGYISGHDETPDQGTQTESGTIDVTFVVNHGGVRMPQVVATEAQVSRRPLSPEALERIEKRRAEQRASVEAGGR